MVDRSFGRFDLADPADYGRFLTAHARVLPAIERELECAELLTGWSGRRQALEDDLAAMAIPMPRLRASFCFESDAAQWGALYVIEGSRLGGLQLSRRVKEGLPKAYLSAGHEAGGWRHLLARLDEAAEGREWRDAAVKAAKSVFRAYADAAEEAGVHG
nr:biliverdin-producing heme oxygenase [Sphingomonas laterariae]